MPKFNLAAHQTPQLRKQNTTLSQEADVQEYGVPEKLKRMQPEDDDQTHLATAKREEDARLAYVEHEALADMH